MNIPEALKSCPDLVYDYFFDIDNTLFLLYIFFCKNQVKMGQLHGLEPLILKDFFNMG